MAAITRSLEVMGDIVELSELAGVISRPGAWVKGQLPQVRAGGIVLAGAVLVKALAYARLSHPAPPNLPFHLRIRLYEQLDRGALGPTFGSTSLILGWGP